MKIGIFLLSATLVAQATQGTADLRPQIKDQLPQANDQFVKESLSRLSAKAPAEQLKGIQDKATRWRQTRSNADFLILTDAIYAAAKDTNSKSDVTLESSKGSGASVKYQTLGERQRNEPPTTAKDLTKATESMFIGMYHIWCERDGKATSDRNAQYDIAKAKEHVTCQEQK